MLSKSKKDYAVPANPRTRMGQKPPMKQRISPWVWGIFVCSVVVWLLLIFLSLNRPTFFPIYQVVPSILRPLPDFLAVPTALEGVWLPLFSILGLCSILRWIPANNFTRLMVRGVMAVLALRYVVWRCLVTLNFSHGMAILVSAIFLANEITWISSYILYLLQSTWTTTKKRSQQADRYEQDVFSGYYQPSVDVFVPTYKEPEYVVRRTVIGCQAMEYPNKTVYILDDTRRPHIRALAKELGCEYITRPNNNHAKAGNLNNALGQTKGELITVMDADFVPFKNFLTRTVGFFQQDKVDLVQTPQFFYNADYHARNLGLENLLPNDLEHFFGYVQPARDTCNSVICCGTSYVVRRSSIEAIGGYYTGCCVEDYQTSIKMLTHGFRLIYLNEMLSMGESTRTFADFIDQRLRWLQGNLQVYFRGKDLPIWSKLNWIQKSFHVTLIAFSLNPIIRFFSLTVPLISLYLGPSPLVASLPEYIYYAIPFTLMYNISFTWATDYRMSAFWSEVYDTTFCFPALQRLWLILRNPFAKASTATRKGVKEEGKNYNLHLTWPLLVLLGLTAFGIFLNYGGYWFGIWPAGQHEYEGKSVLLFWVIYNSFVMGTAVLSGVDQPVRRTSDRFPLHTSCKLTIGDHVYWGYTNDVCEQGSSITLTTERFTADGTHATLELLDSGLCVQAKLKRSTISPHCVDLSVEFVNLTLEQNRQLVNLLYCNLDWWKHRKRPGIFDSALAMFTALLSFRPVLSTYSRTEGNGETFIH